MKRIMTFTGWLVMAATLFAGMTACSKENNTIDDPVPTETPTTYTLTVEATKGDAMTRALTLEGKTLNATWTVGDVVYVQKGSDDAAQTLGSLTATNVRDGGLTCTLTGELTTLPNVNDELTLKYLLGAYGTQKGTLEGIATKHDAAIATVTVATVDTEAKTITTTGVANFENQQSVVKFSLKKPDGTTPFVATNLTVKHGSKTYRVSPETPSSELFVAIPGNYGDVRLEATDGTETYFYKKTGVDFANGKYYAIGVKMNTGNVDLSQATGDVTLMNGDVAYGELAGNYKVSVNSGAEVTLNGVTIAGSDDETYDWAGITCRGTATINLMGQNTVRASYKNYPGIYIPSDRTLTIQGDGELDVSSSASAGIGAGYGINCGNIVIKGGHITATGSSWGAGIGGYLNETCGDITISGGSVTATGGEYAAGIGGKCGNITISGGTITATGGDEAAGIGSRNNGTCSKITISGGSVTAAGGKYATGIGTGKNSTCGKISISGGTVTAAGGKYAAGIGSGERSTCGKISINGGKVTATGGDYGAGIGSGKKGSCDNISVSGGTITATGGHSGPGIGTGENGPCGDITISGGTVTATGGDYAGGIGSGKDGTCGNITITKEVTSVTAYKTDNGVEFIIGKYSSGDDCSCGTITIGGKTYYDGTSYKNNGGNYLATNPFIYQP